MKKYTIIFLCLFGLMATATSMQPGTWKSVTSFRLNGIQVPSNESQACVSASEASDVKSTIGRGLKKDGCDLTKWDLKGTQLSASVSCKNKDIEADGNLKGTVTAKSYNLEGDAQGVYKNTIPSVAKLKLTGTWISKTCKK